MGWQIRFYETSRGDRPVNKYTKTLDKQSVAKLDRLLSMLKSHGPELGMPYARYLGGKLYELRIRSQNETRIFYICMVASKSVVLLHAFRKQSQKLPEKELQIARSRQAELT